jgi:hypothetical protein
MSICVARLFVIMLSISLLFASEVQLTVSFRISTMRE